MFENKSFDGKETIDQLLSAPNLFDSLFLRNRASRGPDIRSFFSTAHVGGYTIDDSREVIGGTGKLEAIVVALREDGEGGEPGRFLW